METDELTQYLNSLHREDCYRVDAVLKESAFETTQRVYFVGSNGAENGPFIRKFIARESGLGSAYERIYAAQQAGQRFKHIPRVLECYQHGDQLAVVMEYVQGETLQDYVYRKDPSPELAYAVFPALCEAVSELHDDFAPSIIHRDLKPSNIILSEGNLTIIDFGISREFKDDASADTTQFGTRAFAPPEQFGYGQTTVRSDVYALGMLLYFCLTERIPDAATRESGFDDPELSAELRAVIRRATQFDPDNRYESVRQLREAFLAAFAQMNGEANAASQSIAPSESVRAAEPSRSEEKPTISSRFTALGVFWDFCLLICLAGILTVSVNLAFNPGETTAHYPAWLNYLGYLVIIPLSAIGGAWVVADKRLLMRRFPKLYRFRTSKVILWYLAMLIVFFVALSIISTAMGA